MVGVVASSRVWMEVCACLYSMVCIAHQTGGRLGLHIKALAKDRAKIE